jgi:hypothetical protein
MLEGSQTRRSKASL